MIDSFMQLSTLSQIGIGLGAVGSWCIGFGMGIAAKAYYQDRKSRWPH